MTKIIIASAFVCCCAAAANAQTIEPMPAFCAPGAKNCYELVVESIAGGKDVVIIEVGPGGKLCGPAKVRGFDGKVMLDVAEGVCIPAAKMSLANEGSKP
jgi:hypothetical protein